MKTRKNLNAKLQTLLQKSIFFQQVEALLLVDDISKVYYTIIMLIIFELITQNEYRKPTVNRWL